jgi:prepilin-type N-terminal cleavage/methylation domain-containing protein
MLNNKKGLTLIEILIVFCIIGIVAAMVIPNILGVKKKSYHPSNREIIQMTDEVARLDTTPAKVTLIAEIEGYKLYTVRNFSGEIHILIPPKYTQDVAKIIE